MGKLLDLLQAAAGESSLHSLIGRWRQEVSADLDQVSDSLEQTAARVGQIESIAAGEVTALAGPGLVPDGTQLAVGQNPDNSVIVNADNVQVNPTIQAGAAAGATALQNAGAGLTEAPAGTVNVGANADGSIVVNANDIQVSAAIQAGAAAGATAVQPTPGGVLPPGVYADDILVWNGAAWVDAHNLPVMSQLSWKVDSAAGNDANAGTPASPLQTWAELGRRFDGKYIPNSVDILVSGNVSADATRLNCFGPASAQITIHGTPVAQATGGTGAITAFTAENAATATDAKLTDTGATWATHTKQRIRLTSGTVGALFWVLKDLGAAQARVNQAMTTVVSATGSLMTSATPAIGNTYVVETLPDTIGALQIEVYGGLRVLIADCTIVSVSSVQSYFTAGHNTSSAGTRAVIQGCILSGTHNFRGCYCAFASCSFDGLFFTSVGIQIANGNVFWNTCTIQQGCVWDENIANANQGARMAVSTGALMGLFGSHAFYDVVGGASAILNVGTRGAALSSSGTAICWGISNTGAAGIQVNSYGSYVYVTKPTLATPTQDTIIGGTATAYAGIPFVNAANLAGMVANA